MKDTCPEKSDLIDRETGGGVKSSKIRGMEQDGGGEEEEEWDFCKGLFEVEEKMRASY